jgi:hypothetical protein
MKVRINNLEIPPEILKGLQKSFEVEHAPELGQFEIE